MLRQSHLDCDMHAGQHGDFLWELKDDQLIISSIDARIGVLTVQTATNRFNNEEQATWFAQGQIDMQLETLNARLEERRHG